MKNIIKCDKCGNYLSSEFFDSHKCILNNNNNKVKEIPVVFYSKTESNAVMAKGWDGILYRIVISKVKSKVKSYVCSSTRELKGIAEIPVVIYFETESNAVMAKGWDDILYKFKLSKISNFNQSSDEFLQEDSSDKDFTEPSEEKE